MAEELALSRGELDYNDPRAVLERFDEAGLRAVLLEVGVDLEDFDEVSEAMFEPGDGTVFWPFEAVRDGTGRVIALAGDHYYEPGHTPESVRGFFDALQALAARLEATTWIYPGPRRFEGEERARYIADVVEATDHENGPRVSQ